MRFLYTAVLVLASFSAVFFAATNEFLSVGVELVAVVLILVVLPLLPKESKQK